MASSTSDAITSEAALIATFYIDSSSDAASKLTKQLKTASQVKGTLLGCFNPKATAARDTMIIQLLQTAPGDAAALWEGMRGQLEKILTPQSPSDWWGYTLTYQAVLPPRINRDQALEELLPAVQRLHSSESVLEPLAQADLSGGRIWLLGLPKGDGLAAATLYVALSPPDKVNAFMNEVLYGQGARLLVPDLIVHKSYFQNRHYSSGDLPLRYRKTIDRLRETTDQLLDRLAQQNQPLSNLEDQQNQSLSDLDRIESGRQRQIEIGELLDSLGHTYYPLVRYIPRLNRRHFSIERQLDNYDMWQAKLEANEITRYHRDHLEAIKDDLELLVAEGRNALETADKTVSMAQVQINKVQVQIDKAQESERREVDEAQEERQLEIEAWLAAAAVALALPHLLEPETIVALLWGIGIELSHNTENGLLTESSHIIVLVAQVAIILPVAILTYRRVKQGSLHKPSGLSKRARL